MRDGITEQCAKARDKLLAEVLYDVDYSLISEYLRAFLRQNIIFFEDADVRLANLIKNLVSLESYADWANARDEMAQMRKVPEDSGFPASKYNSPLRIIEEIADEVNDRLEIPVLLMQNVEEVQNVRFVHSFPPTRLAAITEEGVYGRGTPSRLSHTRSMPDFYVRGGGYIFAYHAPQFEAGNVNLIEDTRIMGEASWGMQFFWTPDGENQMIIPVECIKSYTIVDTGERERYVFDELPMPQLNVLGESFICDQCGGESETAAGAFTPISRDGRFYRICAQCDLEGF